MFEGFTLSFVIFKYGISYECEIQENFEVFSLLIRAAFGYSNVVNLDHFLIILIHTLDPKSAILKKIAKNIIKYIASGLY